MYSKGHIGLTLLISSLLMIPFGYNQNSLLIILFSAGLSPLPDIDLEWQKRGFPIHHRGVTHSILFAMIIGVLFGLLLLYVFKGLLWFGTGFMGGSLGIVSHLIGDCFTYHGFKPLWPFSDREVALKFCSADNKIVNEGLMVIGGLAFMAYLLITTGSLEVLIPLIPR